MTAIKVEYISSQETHSTSRPTGRRMGSISERLARLNRDPASDTLQRELQITYAQRALVGKTSAEVNRSRPHRLPLRY